MVPARPLAALAAALILAAPALWQPAFSQSPAPRIGIEDARRIATENGLVRIQEIELDDGVWEVEGFDAANGKIEIDIHAGDGSVVKIERERPASAATRP